MTPAPDKLALLHDGKGSPPVSVSVGFGGSALSLTTADGTDEQWSWDELREVREPGATALLILAARSRPFARLHVADRHLAIALRETIQDHLRATVRARQRALTPQPAAPAQQSGTFFDGRSSAPVPVQLRFGASAVTMARADGTSLDWPYADVRALPGQADAAAMVLSLTTDPAARLYTADPTARSALKALSRGIPAPPYRVGPLRLVKWMAAAVASVLAIVFFLVPVMADRLATLLPPEAEQALGERTMEQVESLMSGGKACNYASIVLLNGMADRLTEGLDLPYPLQIHVLDSPVANAFALPGGHVVFLSGLIQLADQPDQIAAVMAHEIGHVIARDPTRSALRSAGSVGVLGLLLGDFAGGSLVVLATRQLIEADHSRQAEAAADRFAQDRLRAAGISPAALGDLFEHLAADQGAGDEGGLMAHFASHPELGDRIAAARAAPGPDRLVPILTDEQWRQIQLTCD